MPRIFNPFSGLRAFRRPGFSVRVCRFSSSLPRRDEKGKKPDASLFDPCPAARSRVTNFESARKLPFRSRRLYKAKPRRPYLASNQRVKRSGPAEFRRSGLSFLIVVIRITKNARIFPLPGTRRLPSRSARRPSPLL
jgi:hypothetical protein